jgi:PAS domain S-box-containing protein
MSEKMRVLIVEDNPTDVEILIYELKKSKLPMEFSTVCTEQDYTKALEEQPPDLIFSDYSMPSFTGMRALEIRESKAPEIPFILVTGSMNEETAVSCMRAGADDYLIKGNLTRINQAMRVATEKHQVMHAKRQTEIELQRTNEKFRTAFEYASVGMALVGMDKRFIQVNQALCEITGYSAAELIGKSFEDITYTHDLALANENFDGAQENNSFRVSFEKRYIKKDGEIIWVHLNSTPVKDECGNHSYFITHIQDISQRKRAEEALEKRLIALTSPTNVSVSLNFEDVFNIDEIQKIQDAFSNATGVASLITDAQGNPLTKPSNSSAVCQLIRSTEQGLRHCRESECYSHNVNQRYWKCQKAGLFEGVAVIHAGEQHIANWLVGQVLDESANLDELYSYANSIGLDEERVRQALGKTNKLSAPKFGDICESLHLISEQLSHLAIQNMQQARHITDMKTLTERFNRAQHIGSVGNWELDLNTLYMWASDEAFHIYGIPYNPNGLPLNVIQKAVLPEYRPQLDRALQYLLTEDVPYDLEFPITRIHDGNLRYVHSKAVVTRDSSRNPIKVLGVIQDITARRITEDALRQSESRFWHLFNDAPIGYQEIDIHGRVTLVNQTELDLLGYEKQEMLGEYIWNFVHDKDSLKDIILKKLKNESPVELSFEYTFVKKNGTVIDIAIDDRPLFDESGKIRGLRSTLQDITFRKQNEHALIESEAKFRAVFEQAAVGVALVDTQSLKFIRTNKKYCAILGLSEDDIMRKDFTSMTHPEDLPMDFENMEKLKQGLVRSFSIEKRYLRGDGSTVWVNLTVSPMWQQGEKPTSHIGIIEDITGRKLAETQMLSAKEKAEEMSRLKSSFLANMSHELRTPLMGILGYSEVLGLDAKDDVTLMIANVIHDSGRRLLETLNLILDLSRIEAGKLPMRMRKTDVVEVIKEICKLFETTAQKKDISLSFTSDVASLVLFLDERMLREILTNLVNNGLKYTVSGSVKIHIEKIINRDANEVHITVSDTGIGIAPEDITFIFDEFRQASEGLGRTFEGTGLGLTITKRFIEKLNGRITVESKPGVGSTFHIYLPMDNVYERKPESKPVAEITDHVVEKIKKPERMPEVLYVEDDPIAVDLVSRNLFNICKIESAFNALEGIAKAEAKHYDAILMDINLGKGMDGVQATRKVRTLEQHKTTPIVAITAFAMTGDKEEFLNAGCTHYISKPFRRDELFSVMKDVLKL